ncbi:MAG: thiamine pyrophosphate-dependent dehydrogenase E1 component subunit alpha [bacterium]|nr:thiamine pyrophosphate-dependent dehydrogenase E1 component subunit alpha [bacterium]
MMQSSSPVAVLKNRTNGTQKPPARPQELSRQVLLDLYQTMVRVRRVEEAIGNAYPEQEMKCPVHLSIGQEGVAAGVCLALRKDDEALSTHRGHAHYLAKGGNLKRMIAELYGKSTGCARGKGGSMHMVDTSVGFRGSSAIVAGTIPIAAGLAMAAQMQGRNSVAVAFFGDGAADEGVLYETLNFAALKKLPVLFICENNLYATHSHQSARQPADNLIERANAFGVTSTRIDGNNAPLVYQTTQEAVKRARAGQGPTFLECMTYRWRKHVGPESDIDMGYRTQEELDSWIARCPIRHLEEKLQRTGQVAQEELERIHTQIDTEIQEAFAFAKNSPSPTAADLHTFVDANGSQSMYARCLPVESGKESGVSQHNDITAIMQKTGF